MRIAVYGRYLEDSNLCYVQSLFDELAAHDIAVSVYKDFYPQLESRIKLKQHCTLFQSYNDIKDAVDYLFSIGGDGTLLDTLALVRDSGIPVLGINVGRLGFLSSVAKEEIDDAIQALKKGAYTIDKRELIHLDSSKPLFDDMNFALNEFTVHKKDTSSMIIIHTFLDGEFLNSYWADGLIVATPTGSTAYSLSCGGPVIFPNAHNFVITPVSPHHLNVRPLVVPDSSVISFKLEGRTDSFLCTLDGRMETIDNTVSLSVKKEKFTLNLIRLEDKDFVTTLRNKLLWGYDNRNY